MPVYLKKGAKVPLEHPEHGGQLVPDPDAAYDETDPLVVAYPEAFEARKAKAK